MENVFCLESHIHLCSRHTSANPAYVIKTCLTWHAFSGARYWGFVSPKLHVSTYRNQQHCWWFHYVTHLKCRYMCVYHHDISLKCKHSSFKLHSIKIKKVVVQESAFENVVCKIWATFFKPQCIYVMLCFSCQVVGLGNHTLLNTRHSVGMQFVNYLATQLQMTWSRDRSCQAFIAQAPLGPELELYLLKSRHPMNITGKSVAKAGEITRLLIQCGAVITLSIFTKIPTTVIPYVDLSLVRFCGIFTSEQFHC